MSDNLVLKILTKFKSLSFLPSDCGNTFDIKSPNAKFDEGPSMSRGGTSSVKIYAR